MSRKGPFSSFKNPFHRNSISNGWRCSSSSYWMACIHICINTCCSHHLFYVPWQSGGGHWFIRCLWCINVFCLFFTEARLQNFSKLYTTMRNNVWKTLLNLIKTSFSLYNILKSLRFELRRFTVCYSHFFIDPNHDHYFDKKLMV